MTKMLSKTLITTAVISTTLFVAQPVFADTTPTSTPKPTATATPKPTATPTPIIETRVECTTGAYGQQTCKTVEIRKVLGETTTKGGIRDTGVEDTVLFGAFALMGLSLGGLVISKRK